MADILKEPGEKVKALTGNWTAVTALGSFALYLLGYLSLRFHLTVFGIGTDLSVIDERYIFEGARFLVYLVSSVPVIVMILLVLAVLLYIPWRVLTAAMIKLPDRVRGRIIDWWSAPNRLALTGIIISVVLIQFVMRQPLLFINLLLAQELPEPDWLQFILLSENEAHRVLFFCALLAGIMITAVFFFSAWNKEGRTATSGFLTGLLGFLICVQFLFLPINYGILISGKTIPRVSGIGGKGPVAQDREAWLAWEGKEGVTFLVRNRQAQKNERSLVTVLRKDVGHIEITGYDPILRQLFSSEKTRVDKEGERSTKK